MGNFHEYVLANEMLERYGNGQPDMLYMLWKDIQELIGPAKLWPKAIRRFFWTKNIRNWPRVRVCAFAFVNGLPAHMLLHWGIMVQMWTGVGDPSYRHAARLMYIIEHKGGHCKYKLWAWNVHNNRGEYLDGTPRRY